GGFALGYAGGEMYGRKGVVGGAVLGSVGGCGVALGAAAGLVAAGPVLGGLIVTLASNPGTRNTLLQSAAQSFGSFSSFRRAMGSAGPNMSWHHIVEQTPGNLARFGAEA